jgi:hypothetical protein
MHNGESLRESDASINLSPPAPSETSSAKRDSEDFEKHNDEFSCAAAPPRSGLAKEA